MYEKKDYSLYHENDSYGNGYRVTYLKGIKKLLDMRKEECHSLRMRTTQEITQNREKYRQQYLNMLGWPLTEEKHPILNVSRNKIFEDDNHVFYRMQFELFEGFRFYGILFQHKDKQALPLVITQHGGLGTPELCSSFFGSSNYNDMSMRIFHKGVNVFAPQTLLWRQDRFGPQTERKELDLALKQYGSSIAAVEIYSIMKCLDYFEEQPFCNNTFGMAGLSYGGFYTLYTAAADTRIKASLACSHFNDRTVYNWGDKVWFDSASKFLDAQVALLVCPRFLRIEVGDNDEIFDVSTAKQEYEIVKEHYTPNDNVQFHVFQGVHEFCPKDDGIDIFINRLCE